MGRRSLSNTEIHHRLQRLRNLTRLYAAARQKLHAALATVRELQALLVAKDARIAELEAQLANKELERKTLASYLYRAGTDKALECGEAKPQGKRPGAPAYTGQRRRQRR